MSTIAQVEAQPRPRLRGWSLIWRYGLCLVWWAFWMLTGYTLLRFPDDAIAMPWQLLTLDGVLGLVCLYLIRFRRRHPILMAIIITTLVTVSVSGSLVASWAVIHVAARRRWREIVPVIIVVLALTLVSATLQVDVFKIIPLEGGSRLIFMLQVFIWGVLAGVIEVAIGHVVGARRDLVASLRDRAEEAERNQELLVLQGQSAERNRIAREMHDVLAHRISLVSMHAGVLAYRTDLSPEQTQEIANLIQENAHQSLTELRGVLGSLRDESPTDEGSAPRPIEKPQPTMLQIEDLVRDARAAGERIAFTSDVAHPELLPTLVGRHAYRVVQEALTNARKHAPHAKVSLSITGRPAEGLRIRCTNPLTSQSSGVPGAGVGLMGLSERAQITGGRIDHRVTEDRNFVLEVWLPW